MDQANMRNRRVSQIPSFPGGINEELDIMELTINRLQLTGQVSPDASYVPFGFQRENATAYQARQISNPAHLTAKPDAAVARPQSQPSSSSAWAAKDAKPTPSFSADVRDQKRSKAKENEARSRDRKKDGVNRLYEGFYSLPEGYRHSVFRRAGIQKGKWKQKLSQADLFVCAAILTEDHDKCLGLTPEAITVPIEERELMAIDEETLLNVEVTDSVSGYPGPSTLSYFFGDDYQWSHVPLGGFENLNE